MIYFLCFSLLCGALSATAYLPTPGHRLNRFAFRRQLRKAAYAFAVGCWVGFLFLSVVGGMYAAILISSP